MPIDNNKPDNVTPRRTSTEPHGVFGEPSDDRPIVTEQRSDPTHGRGENPSARSSRAAKKDHGSTRTDEEMQRASESGTTNAADEKRASDGVDTEGRLKR